MGPKTCKHAFLNNPEDEVLAVADIEEYLAAQGRIAALKDSGSAPADGRLSLANEDLANHWGYGSNESSRWPWPSELS